MRRLHSADDGEESIWADLQKVSGTCMDLVVDTKDILVLKSTLVYVLGLYSSCENILGLLFI